MRPITSASGARAAVERSPLSLFYDGPIKGGGRESVEIAPTDRDGFVGRERGCWVNWRLPSGTGSGGRGGMGQGGGGRRVEAGRMGCRLMFWKKGAGERDWLFVPVRVEVIRLMKWERF